MKLPIVIAEGLDLLTFSSLSDATGHLEVTDVRDGVYIAFDAEGRLLKLSAVQDTVVIEPAEVNPAHAEQLRELLERYLGHIGKLPASPERLDLRQLVEVAHGQSAYTRPESVWAVIKAFWRSLLRQR